MESMEQLITVECGVPAAAVAKELALPKGQQPIFPEDNTPTDGSQLGVSEAKASSVKSANTAMLASVAGIKSAATPAPSAPFGPGLTVEVTGNVSIAGSQFSTLHSSGPSTVSSPPAATPATPFTPALHAAPALHEEDSDEDEGEDFTVHDIDPEVVASWTQALQPVPATTAPRPQPQQVNERGPAKTDVVLSAAEKLNTSQAVPSRKFDGDNVLDGVDAVVAWVAPQVTKMLTDTGIALLGDPKAVVPGSYIHECIRRVRWETINLSNLGPQELLQMETALAAHQVYVQAEENRWTALFNHLGRDLERVIIAKRDNYNGTKTKAEAENRLIEAEPRVRDLRNQYILAQYMSQNLAGMGERFAQMDNGLKRQIDFVVEEYRRAHFNVGQR